VLLMALLSPKKNDFASLNCGSNNRDSVDGIISNQGQDFFMIF
jgi:hypothetical protein